MTTTAAQWCAVALPDAVNYILTLRGDGRLSNAHFLPSSSRAASERLDLDLVAVRPRAEASGTSGLPLAF
jgi:hypothetical protein